MKKIINGMPLNLTDKLINVDGELFVLSQEEVQLRKQANNLHLEFVMYEALREKNWKQVCSMATDTPWMYKEIFKHFEEMPDECKVKLALSAYADKGDKYSFIRSAVRRCADLKETPKLPPELAAQKTIIVYRAGEEDIDHAKYRLSWSTDKRVAFWFHSMYYRKHSNHVWQAEITPGDEIAYLTERKESEVLQYRKVKNIIDITAEAETEQGYSLAKQYIKEAS